MDDIIDSEPGKKVLLLGNEAIARGAIESGIAVATTYPGTPASEIGDTLFRIADKIGFYFEYSINEKVATEIAIGAAVSGVRALVSMKHVGVNVASDPLMTFAYTGTRGGFLLVSADDTSCHSSQNEQDSRCYALFGGFPLLEPSSSQECYEMTKYAFDVSEELELPVMLRTTTRISHIRGPVTVGEMRAPPAKAKFEKEPTRFVTVPAVARVRHLALLAQLKKAERIAEESRFNRVIHVNGGGNYGIITSSAAANCALDASKDMGLPADILKLGFSNPIPKEKILEFLRNHETVAVVEELEPVLELQVRSVAQNSGTVTRVVGKLDGVFPRAHEFDQDIVARGLSNAFSLSHASFSECESLENLPDRPPVLCAGCPHSATYFAIEKVTKHKALFASDIGCYTLGVAPPYSAADLLVCMGSSVGTAGGLAKVNDLPTIAFIGDSTFFHSGIPALINAVHHRHKFLLIVLDNRTTAMTGHQPHPGSSPDPRNPEAIQVPIENIVRGCGVQWLKTIDPYETNVMIDAVNEALARDEVGVIVARRECALIAKRDDTGAIIRRHHVDQDACKKCRTCVTKFQCPAISSIGKVQSIDRNLCAGCGVCANVCPYDAIKEDD
ncbi:MAG: indolepyruvate ferredoxin oxidoreductase subunit alpha [Methanobacteriota archaeon]|nr:MAG: indolepyruvate ferredoxin oxidoreductase subunit alpha [Euryarchaeota archaeon]